MKILQTVDFEQMERRYRAAFFNTAGGFKPVHLVGTANGEGKYNLSIFNSIFHLGANPPLWGMVIRPHSVERHTWENILETGFYTLNAVPEAFFRQAHQTSAKYSREVSEFDACGFTPVFHRDFPAPFVAESPVQIGLKLVDQMHVSLNDTIIAVGQIVCVAVQEDCVGLDGYVDIEKAGAIACTGLDAYHRTQRLARLSYAKPDTPLHEIPTP